MTLIELINRAKEVGLKVTSSYIPLVQDGKEVDFLLSLNDDLTVKVEKVVSNIKSPFSGGPVVEEWVAQNITYRGIEVSIHRRQYRCVDTGHTFCTTEMEEDAIWEIVRKYCEKQGISVFELMRNYYEKDNV